MIKKIISKLLWPSRWNIGECRDCKGKTFDGTCPSCVHEGLKESE